MKISKWKLFGMLFSGCLLLSMSTSTVFAAQAPAAGGLCEHHTEHDADCGYTEAVSESACSHEHTKECYKTVEKCVHEHDADCYEQKLVCEVTEEGHEHDAGCYEDVLSCKHDCSEESGCITQELSCRHEHNDECGYQAAVEGMSCGYVCDECSAEEEAAAAQAEIVTLLEMPENEIALMSSGIVDAGSFENLKWELNDKGTLTITGSGDMPIRSSAGGYPWNSYLSSQNSKGKVKRVLIESGITSVSVNAFYNAETIEEVQLADSVTYIGSSAFSGCKTLKALKLSNNLAEIGGSAFLDCVQLSLDKLPASLTMLRSSAFKGCSNITLSELPAGLLSIYLETFKGCEAIKTMKIPAGTRSIDSTAFANSGIVTLIFEGKQAPAIAHTAFSGCAYIAQIKLPEGATGYDNLIDIIEAVNNKIVDVTYSGGSSSGGSSSGSTSGDSSSSSGKSSSHHHHSSSGGSASAAKPVSAEDSKRAAQAARDASALALYTPAQYVMLQDGRFVEAAVRVGGTSDEMRTAFAAVSPAFGLTVADTFAASVEGIDSADTVTIFLAPGSIPKDGILLAVDALGNLTLAKTETFADGTMAVTIPASCQIAVCTMAAASAA